MPPWSMQRVYGPRQWQADARLRGAGRKGYDPRPCQQKEGDQGPPGRVLNLSYEVAMALDFHEFSKEEYELRFEKARGLMNRFGFEAILVGDEKNYRYFTGDRPPTKNRPTFILLPLMGDPIVIASDFGAKTAKFITYVSDVRGYPMPFTYGIVADAIRSLCGKR